MVLNRAVFCRNGAYFVKQDGQSAHKKSKSKAFQLKRMVFQTLADNMFAEVKTVRAKTTLTERLSVLSDQLYRMNLTEYLRYLDDGRRIFRVNFWAGVARGIGIWVGFSILGALTAALLVYLASKNLPVIGEFIQKIVLLLPTQGA